MIVSPGDVRVEGSVRFFTDKQFIVGGCGYIGKMKHPLTVYIDINVSIKGWKRNEQEKDQPKDSHKRRNSSGSHH